MANNWWVSKGEGADFCCFCSCRWETLALTTWAVQYVLLREERRWCYRNDMNKTAKQHKTPTQRDWAGTEQHPCWSSNNLTHYCAFSSKPSLCLLPCLPSISCPEKPFPKGCSHLEVLLGHFCTEGWATSNLLQQDMEADFLARIQGFFLLISQAGRRGKNCSLMQKVLRGGRDRYISV